MRRQIDAVALALLASIAFGSVLMLVVGRSPGDVWGAMIVRTFTSSFQVGQVLYKATALILTGLGVALALDAGLFNIGGEGQLAAGALACAGAGTALPEATPAVVAIVVCMLAAAGAGAAIGALIGVLRVARGASEVITSIMLNAIVNAFVLWFAIKYVFVNGTTTGGPIIASAELPSLPLGGSAANATLAIALAAAAALWWLRARSAWGQAWLAVGRDPEAARSVGISVGRVQVLALTGSGALCGLAAANFVLGDKHAFEDGLGSGFGYIGIAAALLGRLHPLGVVAAALLFGFLTSGGLVVNDKVPKEITDVLVGFVVLAVAVTSAWARRKPT
jgi:simple sugar transport system permease protein